MYSSSWEFSFRMVLEEYVVFINPLCFLEVEVEVTVAEVYEIIGHILCL